MSASPPPTPPLKDPNPEECRFEPTSSLCEWVEQYRPGGYHPVHLGDVFNNGQYKVIRKLGNGSYSTVWFARDQKNSRYVALKILTSDITESTNELRILRHINQIAPEQGSQYITQLLDDFEHNGPNGVHKCLVFEPMGPTVNTMVLELPQFKPRRQGMKVRYPPPMAKAILRQALQALAFLHENGIAHGDLQPGNMLFSLDDIESEPEGILLQEESVGFVPINSLVQRRDGKEDPWAPRYLYTEKPLAPFVNLAGDFKIKLSDMGGAYFFTDPPVKPVTPVGLRPPELILTGTVNNTLDVWSFGCLVFELITGQPLFCVLGYSSPGMEDDDHLLSLTTYLGPLPDELYKHWKKSSFYFTDERELFNCQVQGVYEEREEYEEEEAEAEAEPIIIQQTSMEELFDETNPDLGQDEARQIKLLIRRILQYDPAKRPTPAEILRDPWFCGETEYASSNRSLYGLSSSGLEL